MTKWEYLFDTLNWDEMDEIQIDILVNYGQIFDNHYQHLDFLGHDGVAGILFILSDSDEKRFEEKLTTMAGKRMDFPINEFIVNCLYIFEMGIFTKLANTVEEMMNLINSYLFIAIEDRTLEITEDTINRLIERYEISI